MKRREEYRAKITNDTGVIRSRVPSPLLRMMNARPGDKAVFSYEDKTAVMRIERAKGKDKKKKS